MNTPITHSELVTNLMKPGKQIQDEMTPHKASLAHMALGLLSDAGEAADVIKKHVFYGQPLNHDHLVEELGDVLFFFEGILQLTGHDWESVRRANITKLLKRYQGGKFSNQDAQLRADKA